MGRFDREHPNYKWVALSNTTLGMTMATINASIVLISLPAIFRGISLDPLAPANVTYLLWMLMGFLLVTAVLVVTFGRLGDLKGRVRIYNLGFLVFAFASIALSLVPWHGTEGATWLIGWRCVQAVGAAMLMANSTAILTDAFPLHQRGMALGINQVAAIAGSFLGLVIGGVLSEWHWRAVFWVSVPFGVARCDLVLLVAPRGRRRHKGRLDIPGNVTFALGLGLLLTGVTYGIQPHGTSAMGWTSPAVLAELSAGSPCWWRSSSSRRRSEDPMLHMGLFKIRAFALGQPRGLPRLDVARRPAVHPHHLVAGHLAPPPRLQLREHPAVGGHLLAAPHGRVSRVRAGVGRLSATSTAHGRSPWRRPCRAIAFVGLMILPVDFPYPLFAAPHVPQRGRSGMFSAPNTSMVMNSVPADQRGAASGLRMTFFNSGSALSIGVFFSLMVIGLSATLPTTLSNGLVAQGVPPTSPTTSAVCRRWASCSPPSWASTRSRPCSSPSVCSSRLPSANVATLTGKDFFPR